LRSPIERILPFAERADLNDLAVAERMDIGKAPIDPLRVVFQSDSHMK